AGRRRSAPRRDAVKRACVLALVAACGDNALKLAYDWDDRRVLCSEPVDDYETAPDWGAIDRRLGDAESWHAVAMFHAHVPGTTVTRDTLEHLFSVADAHHLGYVTFRELEPGAPRAAIAFAFDDNSPDAWVSVRDVLAAHHARITLFVTRWTEMTDA